MTTIVLAGIAVTTSVVTVVTIAAWLVDSRARRTAWVRIARARRIDATTGAARRFHVPETCPNCRADVRGTGARDRTHRDTARDRASHTAP